MKKYLLPESGNFYKANLHCHTTVSDGSMTPEEVKSHYMANGYSIIAFTDHSVFLDRSELAEEGFLPLNGFEAEVDEKSGKPRGYGKTCHICFVAKDPGNLTIPFYHRSKYLFGNGEQYRDQMRFDETQPDYIREYTPECVNDMIRRGKEAGFFVTYNHPVWSLEDYSDYMAYEGMDAMEIMNYGCWIEGYMEYNPKVYDDMLRGGKRIYALSTDDNHSKKDTLGGWIMVKAEKLDYTTVMQALEKGEFYSSWGPEIRELWYEDGYVHVKTSEARRIVCNYSKRKARCTENSDGTPVTEATFPVTDDCGYFRITVMDAQGRCADTNACFVDDLR